MGRGVKIIPILLKPTQMHQRLSSLQHFDFSSGKPYNYEPLLEDLRKIMSTATSVLDNPFSEATIDDLPRLIKVLRSNPSEERERQAIDALKQLQSPLANEAIKRWRRERRT